MSTEARARVLSLYKQILRTGRLWDGPTEVTVAEVAFGLCLKGLLWFAWLSGKTVHS